MNGRLKALIALNNLNQKEFAILLSISDAQLTSYIKGRSRPEPVVADLAAKLLHCQPFEIFAQGVRR